MLVHEDIHDLGGLRDCCRWNEGSRQSATSKFSCRPDDGVSGYSLRAREAFVVFYGSVAVGPCRGYAATLTSINAGAQQTMCPNLHGSAVKLLSSFAGDQCGCTLVHVELCTRLKLLCASAHLTHGRNLCETVEVQSEEIWVSTWEREVRVYPCRIRTTPKPKRRNHSICSSCPEVCFAEWLGCTRKCKADAIVSRTVRPTHGTCGFLSLCQSKSRLLSIRSSVSCKK